MNLLHDIPGNHREWVQIPAYTGATDDGYRDPLLVAPFVSELLTVGAYFTGTANVVGGTAGDYFTYTLYAGTVPIATAGLEGTVAYGSALSVFSGTQDMSAGDVISIQYGTAGGTAELDAPRALADLTFRGA